ncbi:10322_t:CDS:2 [Acaulospora morrowiae]|uniref:10322_t:CDS:1 n=1 Tax=Acaulospora morrowiae TaxID=94023 RepID=A0A9N9ARD2_9GLOM|nr:10322_t:CDS:2 [Acaulospora morrowiae]
MVHLFQIRLEDDTLTMRGTTSESVGCVLRGQLVLAITEPTKIREVKLTFQGTSKISWTDGAGTRQFYRAEERIIYQHEWVFLPAQKNLHVLQPDNYHWDFELVLPGTLPETIEGCERGSIDYRLKAIAERPTLAINFTAKRKVTIQRCLLPSSLEYMQSMIVSNIWTDKMEYEFNVDYKAYTLGDTIRVSMDLRPLKKHLNITKFSCILKEYITYHVGIHAKEEARVVCCYLDSELPEEGETWIKSFEVPLPKTSSLCHYDSQNEIIDIKHKLKFNVAFTEDGKNPSELRAAMQIIITPISPTSDRMILPAYREHQNDQLFLEDCDWPSSPSSSASSISSSSFSDSLSVNSDTLPSYRSIASCIPAPLADSLLPPTYDNNLVV